MIVIACAMCDCPIHVCDSGFLISVDIRISNMCDCPIHVIAASSSPLTYASATCQILRLSHSEGKLIGGTVKLLNLTRGVLGEVTKRIRGGVVNREKIMIGYWQFLDSDKCPSQKREVSLALQWFGPISMPMRERTREQGFCHTYSHAIMLYWGHVPQRAKHLCA